MRSNWHRALLVSFLMIMSSLAGCLGTDDADEVEEGKYGTVMVSTYHVGEIVNAIAGDTVNVEMMSQDNIPVHDYSPGLQDIVRLSESDLFLYHGLGLEPWVDDALSGMTDAPAFAQVHAMPTGEVDLDYELMLVDKLCDSLSGPSATVITMLAEHAEDAEELHGDDGVHHFEFPEDDHDDDGHDDHDDDHGDHDGGHDEDGHDDHDEDGHDDHGDHGDEDGHDHGDHSMIEAEDTLEANEDCPDGTMISVYHFEAGEYMLEFEGDEIEHFSMAIAQMGGAHHHHHHGHGDGPFEWAGIFEMNDATHTWSMQKVGGDYADPTMKLVLIPTDTPTEETMHDLEGGVEALMDGACTVVEDGETMSPIAADGSCFELHVGSGDDSFFTIDTAGISGMAMYAQHVPTEFERDQHYLKDSAGTDIEPVAQEGAGAHGHGDHGDHGDDHDDHSDDGHDDHDDDMTPEQALASFDTDGDNKLSWDEFWVAWTTDDHDDHDDDGHDDHDHGDHSDHWAPGTCHDTDTHETHDEYTNEEDCEAAGHMWMDEDGHDDHDDHDDDGEMDEMMQSYFMAMLMPAFNNSDADGDALLDINELETFIEAVDNMEDDVSFADMMLLMFDTDGDNLISMDEFVGMMEWMEGDDHDDHEEMHHNFVVVYPDNTNVTLEMEHDMLPDNATAYDFGTIAMTQNNISYVFSDSSLGHYAESIGGIAAPADYSWYWQLHTWNESTESWEESNLGMDLVMMEDSEHIAWAPNSTLDSMIPMPEEDHHDDHDDHDDHDEDGEHTDDGDNHTGDDDDDMMFNETEVMMLAFWIMDANEDGYLDADELDDMGSEDEHHEEGVAFIGLHVEREGEYGIAMPEGVTLHVLTRGGHDGHDDHAGHDDHSDHDDHGDEGENGDEELSYDPHSWLDPVAMKVQTDIVLAKLIEVFPEGEDVFTENADEFKAALDALDTKFKTLTETCTDRSVAANHNAYSYLAYRYDIDFVTVHGLDPEGTPSPEDVAEVVEHIEEEGITVLFVEEYTDASSVDSIVEQTGVSVQILYTMEMSPMDTNDNYLSLMEKNFQALQSGMTCTA